MAEQKQICRVGDTKFTALCDNAVIRTAGGWKSYKLAMDESVTVDIVHKTKTVVMVYDDEKIEVVAFTATPSPVS